VKQIIDSFSEALAGYPRAADDGDCKRIGYLCSYVPGELLGVQGVTP